VHSHPTGSAADARFARCDEFGLGDQVSLSVAGQEVCRIPVRELFPSSGRAG